ncbi:hypothetical protein [Flavobacterium sp. H4147]|uniref:hypothetical protein n=1 Tax=Flavobacterium sp. H4147 TaxID=3034149 RepID=UPI0023ED5CF5|nr:hypothetical protein [Flavobacterium sp. H4147]
MNLWVTTDNTQYRLMNQKLNDYIQLTFELPDGTIEHFNTNYENLYKMLKSAPESLYSPKPL